MPYLNCIWIDSLLKDFNRLLLSWLILVIISLNIIILVHYYKLSSLWAINECVFIFWNRHSKGAQLNSGRSEGFGIASCYYYSWLQKVQDQFYAVTNNSLGTLCTCCYYDNACLELLYKWKVVELSLSKHRTLRRLNVRLQLPKLLICGHLPSAYRCILRAFTFYLRLFQ